MSTFGDALTALRAGDLARRAGWPTDQYLVLDGNEFHAIDMRKKSSVKWDRPTDDILANDWKINRSVEVEERIAGEELAARRARESEEAAKGAKAEQQPG